MLVLYVVNHIEQQKSGNNIRRNTGNVPNCVAVRGNIRHTILSKRLSLVEHWPTKCGLKTGAQMVSRT
jgi:hypothetical protein